MQALHRDLFSTYSIIARDPETGELGGAVQTHQVGVGRLIPFMGPGLGVVASQSLVNQHYNPMALAMLREGLPPQQIINGLTASDTNASRRQVAVLNNAGEVAAFTGSGCIREFGHHTGDGFSVQANMMTKTTVIDAMVAAFTAATGDLAARMLAALQAAQAEDGDIRGMQSAALKVVSGNASDPIWSSRYDIRVDEADDPLAELTRLVTIRQAQHINDDGHRLLAENDVAGALNKWRIARDLTPKQEEIGFWQAVTLADVNPTDDSVTQAATIFNASFADDDRRTHWLDLIGRLVDNGLIRREGAGQALLAAIKRGEG